MAVSGETLYTFRQAQPDVLERGRANKVTMRAERDDAVVAPTVSGSSFSLYSPSGDVLVDAQAITLVGSVATYTIAAEDLPATLTYGGGYRETWVLVMPDSSTRTIDRETYVARCGLQPPAGVGDLRAEIPVVDSMKGNLTSYQPFFDSAWRDILVEIANSGIFEQHIKSAHMLYRPLIELAKYKIFDAWAIGQPQANWREEADRTWKKWEAAWTKFTTLLDTDEDGNVDDPTARASARSGIVQPAGAPYPAGHVRSRPSWA